MVALIDITASQRELGLLTNGMRRERPWLSALAAAVVVLELHEESRAQDGEGVWRDIVGDGTRTALALANLEATMARPRQLRGFDEFFSKPYASMTPALFGAAMDSAWAAFLGDGIDLLNNNYTIVLEERNFPFRRTELPHLVPELRDCGNGTIYGNGPASIFKTLSSAGGDVLQLNALANFHLRNLALEADLTSLTGSGSNGVSVTGGFDNITGLDITARRLPGFWDGSQINGGKAWSIQCDTAPDTIPVGSMAVRLRAHRCAYGFGNEPEVYKHRTRKTAIDVELYAEECFIGYSSSAASPTGVVPASYRGGVDVRLSTVECQIDAWLSRDYGSRVRARVLSKKSADDLRINTSITGASQPWNPSEPDVVALRAGYAKNAIVEMVGSKEFCDYKAKIGGANGAPNLADGSTADCSIYLNVAGTAAIAAIGATADLNDNVMTRTRLVATPATGAIPAALDTLSNDCGDGVKKRTPWRGAMVGLAADTTAVNATGAGVTVQWTQENEDSDAFFAPGSPGSLSIPVGVTRVRLRALLTLGNVAANDTLMAQIRKNSSAIYTGAASGQGKSDFGTVRVMVETPVLTVVGGTDSFSLYLQANADTSIDILANGSWFSIEVVG